jgi:hypothetical protein
VIHKPAAKVDTPLPQSQTQRAAERDTLNDTPELRFLRDEIAALLGSATVQRAVHAPRINYADDHGAIAPEDLGKEWLERATEAEASASSPDPLSLLDASASEESADVEEDTEVLSRPLSTRDTQPSVDVQLQREAARIAGK